ncbi:hypothetical protein DKP76_06355 [Falsochrobactrum shanghaiense]|uniref:VirK protein n=1 Tax=Falsochrobactrum shanghaiense TaxID=2201899 RepID=A0A316J9Q9_9HYPH|nr:VirK family protein [Falsochrobactrum shanghaiense]PWL18697.1 hypothetical protein DKP76_06355 [Falsochrobactrum shanghaiense]
MRWNSGLAVVAAIMSTMGLAHADDMDQFGQFKHHLLAGTRTTALLYAAKCDQSSGDKHNSPEIIGGFAIDSFMNIQAPNETIVFSNTHFTVHPDNAPVIEFVRYEVSADQKAKISVKMLSPNTYEPIGEPRSFDCKLGEGLKFAYGASQ